MSKKPRKPPNRLSVSAAIVQSCHHYANRDADTAFRWAIEALRRAGSERYLNPNEEHYLDTIIRHRGKSQS